MRVLGIHPGLKRRLLIAAARAQREGLAPCDWTDLAELAQVSASPAAINRALRHLAEDGLIEGVCTRSGWLNVRATGRGVRHAGRAAYRHADEARRQPRPAPPAAHAVSAQRSLPPVAPPPADHNAGRQRTAGRLPTRIAAAVSPRVLAVRSQVVQAWRLFRTFP